MRRPLVHALCALLVGSFLAGPGMLFLPGCGGTETGNPGIAPTDVTPVLSENPAIVLMDAICQKLADCLEGVTMSACRSSISASATLGASFGADPETYPSFIDVIAAAEQGTLRADTAEVVLCAATVRDLSCDDERILGVAVQGPELENLEPMVEGNGCPFVFSSAP